MTSDALMIRAQGFASRLAATCRSPARSVARAYPQFEHDLDYGTRLVPDFSDAVAHHQTLDAIERAAEHGVRVTLRQ